MFLLLQCQDTEGGGDSVFVPVILMLLPYQSLATISITMSREKIYIAIVWKDGFHSKAPKCVMPGKKLDRVATLIADPPPTSFTILSEKSDMLHVTHDT